MGIACKIHIFSDRIHKNGIFMIWYLIEIEQYWTRIAKKINNIGEI